MSQRDEQSLAEEYRRQFAWRSWSRVLDSLPSLAGQLVLDLGCGVGDQANALAARGARVIGIDSNEELLSAARARQIAGAEFRLGDLRALDGALSVDGIWCSFAAAYVPRLGPTLAHWKQALKPGGWIALTEVDQLFGHEPLHDETRELFFAYARHALEQDRYDFHMGGKLQAYLEQAGYTVSSVQVVPDQELSFDGPADVAILAAWVARLARMKGLRDFCGVHFEGLREDFIASLTRVEHRSIARVCCCIAVA